MQQDTWSFIITTYCGNISNVNVQQYHQYKLIKNVSTSLKIIINNIMS